jgi:hypothetical protein
MNMIAGSALNPRIAFSGRQAQAPELFFGRKKEEIVFNPWIQIGKGGDIYAPVDEWTLSAPKTRSDFNYLA